MNKYFENYENSKNIRHQQYKQLTEYFDNLATKADVKRQSYFLPDFQSEEKYVASIEKYRRDLKKIIGFPPPAEEVQTEVKEIFVGEDDLCYIYRLFIQVAKGIECYGLYLIPKVKKEKAPLILAFHGGACCPELICNFGEKTDNHNDAARRLVAEGFIVFAPLFSYKCVVDGEDTIIPEHIRDSFDLYTKWLGTSLTAIELFKVSKSLDYLLTRQEVNNDKVGIVGLSYGGFYALMMSAMDTRIKFCISSCYFNDRKLIREKYMSGFCDWVWNNSLERITDVELVALICPRLLIIEVGIRDEMFPIEGATTQAELAKVFYEKLNLGDKFKYIEFDGTHEFNLIDAIAKIKLVLC